MTCCEADMTFLGFMCKAKNARLLETKDWVKVRARVEYEYMPEYEGRRSDALCRLCGKGRAD